VNYDSPKQIKAVLQECGIKLKKRWGQNFLINRDVRERIVSILAPGKNDTIWEIGPGLGSMTALLLPLIKQLICFEIDNGLVRWLSQEFASFNNFIIYQGDIVKTWQKALQERGIPSMVFWTKLLIGEVLMLKIANGMMFFGFVGFVTCMCVGLISIIK